MRVLIIDDDPIQSDFLGSRLSKPFIVEKKDNSPSTIEFISQNQFDAIIVDAHMPIINGFDFVQKIRNIPNTKNVALFMISNDESKQNKIRGLKLNIKDFLSYDYSPEELQLRILNHIKIEEQKNKFGDITIEAALSAAMVGKTNLDLTFIEFKILSCLISSPDKIIPRHQLIQHVWGNSLVLDKTINTHLTNLRAKIAHSSVKIVSKKGKGVQVSIEL